MAGLYIHIPFCASRCIYCDFYSTTGRNRTHFIERLLNERLYDTPGNGQSWETIPFRTVYIGGGTPSQLSAEELHQLIDGLKDRFNLSQVEEFTMEVNPEDVNPAFVESLPKEINRVSMGVQSFVGSELKLLQRRHDAHQPLRAVKLLQAHGISNISIDLMYGLPQQTLESFDYSISEALSLGIQHISAYNLSIEEDTPLDRMIKAGELSVADDDLCNEMNRHLRTRLSNAGFVQYEISNYALPGFHSRHNSAYWDCTPYLGLGPGAHSYNGHDQRWSNIAHLSYYLAGTCSREYDILSEDDQYNERVMLGLRTRRGVNISLLEQHYPSQYYKFFLPAQKRLVCGPLLMEGDYAIIPESALHMTDAIIAQLFAD